MINVGDKVKCISPIPDYPAYVVGKIYIVEEFQKYGNSLNWNSVRAGDNLIIINHKDVIRYFELISPLSNKTNEILNHKFIPEENCTYVTDSSYVTILSIQSDEMLAQFTNIETGKVTKTSVHIERFNEIVIRKFGEKVNSPSTYDPMSDYDDKYGDY